MSAHVLVTSEGQLEAGKDSDGPSSVRARDSSDSDYDGDSARRSDGAKAESVGRNPWIPDEDKAIEELVRKYGTSRWSFVSQMLKKRFGISGRTGKQCRERYRHL